MPSLLWLFKDFIKNTLTTVKREHYLEMSDLEKRKVRIPMLLLIGKSMITVRKIEYHESAPKKNEI